MATVAVFIALGGSSYAAIALIKNSVKSRHIGKGQVKRSDIGTNAVTSAKVNNSSLLARDFKAGELPAGATGPAGPRGAAGQDGSPDTPAQVLEKLKTVDGSGSELDADTLNGQSSAGFVPLQSANSPLPAVPVRFYSYFMDTATANRFDFGQMALEAAGVAGQFRICGDTGGAGNFNWVLYLNGVRSTGLVAGNACTAPFDAAAGGEFQVTMRRSSVFGVHSGDSTTNENYNVYGFGQL
jgi:hypothetical protein